MMHLSQLVALTLTLTLSLQASLVSAGPSLSTGFGFKLDRRVSVVDPGTDVDFKSISEKEPTCKVPCKGLINLSDCASTDYDCTYKALCTESGLNALVTCNNCILQVANRTTGVSTALYDNVTAIDQKMDEKCEEISQPANATVTVLSWADFYPHGNASTTVASTADASTSATATDRSGIAAAASSQAASSGASQRLGLPTVSGVGLAGLIALFMAFV
ncbi:hypothetical protein [Phaffia rhodozyma]|uniref:Uncharacterized protein n=1 Tax=Phaffia rhodozyma TaxID=264483 RepID=A0A0F7SK41_PHARH|nr:hypothetical protein [Phaffia rhodozyma]